jgi:hypothetical protein
VDRFIFSDDGNKIIDKLFEKLKEFQGLRVFYQEQ